jgi:hypothetical protein
MDKLNAGSPMLAALRLYRGAAVLLLSLGSCSASLPGGSAGGGSVGTGGATGTAGTGGSGGSSGSGGSGGSSSSDGGGLDGGGSGGSGAGGGGGAPPGCLADLFAACPIDGACVTQAGGGFAGQYCFASGVVAESTNSGSYQTDDGRTEVRVMKPDGSLCFTLVTTFGLQAAGESHDYTWTDAAGDVVATGFWAFDNPTGSIASFTCMGTGEAFMCGANSAPCKQGTPLVGSSDSLLFGSATCPAGACP